MKQHINVINENRKEYFNIEEFNDGFIFLPFSCLDDWEEDEVFFKDGHFPAKNYYTDITMNVFLRMLDIREYAEELGKWILEDNNYRKFRTKIPQPLIALAHASVNKDDYPALNSLCETAFEKLYPEKNKDFYHAINGIKKHHLIPYNIKDWEHVMRKEIGLTDKEIERIDKVNNAVYRVMSELLDDVALEWNMEWIGELSDAVTQVAVNYFDANEKEFYPYMED